jgi:16S rRNA (uracil1498-N3)-methyltransferase
MDGGVVNGREKRAGRARRLGVESLPAGGGRMKLDPAAAKHARVLRMAAGTPVQLYDGQGQRARGRIISARGPEFVCEVSPPEVVAREGRRVTLIQAMPRGPRMETIVRMATEVGVEAIRPATSERSVTAPSRSRLGHRLGRLQRIAREACAQSGRARAPGIHRPEPLLDAAGRAPEGARRIVFWEQSTRELNAALGIGGEGDLGPDEEVWMVVGPEGGLSGDEVARLGGIGYRDAGLGPAVMRVETAAVVAVALVLDRLVRLS